MADAPAPAAVKKVSKPKKAAAHPPFKSLVVLAVAELKEVSCTGLAAQQRGKPRPPPASRALPGAVW